MVNILCVKWGDKYNHEYVNTLYKSLHQYSFYCYTEDSTGLHPDIKVIPIPPKPVLKVWWNKLALFSRDFPVKGKNIFFDLDVKINSDPVPHLKNIDWSKLNLVDCHWKSDPIYDRPTSYDVRIHSSIMVWESNENTYEIWDHFNQSGYKDYFLRKYVGIDRYIVHEEFEYDLLPSDLSQSKMYEPDKIAPITTFEEYNDKRIVLQKSF
jgi:hypothetical protein